MIELGHIINSIKCRQRDNVAFTDCSYENISNKFHIYSIYIHCSFIFIFIALFFVFYYAEMFIFLISIHLFKHFQLLWSCNVVTSTSPKCQLGTNHFHFQ
jgi:hypothetical protein